MTGSEAATIGTAESKSPPIKVIEGLIVVVKDTPKPKEGKITPMNILKANPDGLTTMRQSPRVTRKNLTKKGGKVLSYIQK